MTATPLTTTCCIAGGGPAGMMLGYLLARAGVDVLVLEKHADFLRDFRGDTVHPSTLEVMHELGLLDRFLVRPHQKVDKLQGWIGDHHVTIADFTHLKVKCPYIALMPQWDFLDFIAQEAKRYPNFRLIMQAKAEVLTTEQGRVTGLTAQTPDGTLTIHSDLVVGADGRHSTVREKAGLTVQDHGVPIDVFWFHISRQASDPGGTLGRFLPGCIAALINRRDYWQCGFVIPKGEADAVRAAGLDAFRKRVGEAVPFFAGRGDELKSWDDVKLLTVKIDRLREWYRPGLLCIGDAAHAMSPVGGVGINLAVQDAVAASNILAGPLKKRSLTDAHLRAVQKRRTLPVRVTQAMHLAVQKRVIGSVLTSREQLPLPRVLQLMQKHPRLQRIPAFMVGIGVRPEHVRKE